MSNVLNEEKQKQVLALGQLGWSLRQIEAATGIRRETAASYLKAAGVAMRQPGGWGRKPKPATEVTPGSPAAEPPKPAIADPEVTTGPEPETPLTESACEPHREQIQAGFARGRNAMSIWQTLVDQHGFPGAYESVKRFVRKLRGQPALEACAIIETAPGEEAQVDYGTGPMVYDPATGKHRRTRLFVFTLGFSRKCVRLLTFQSSTRIWCELHQEAFRRLGGTPRIVVLDNLGEGVLKPGIYDPAINPLYRDLLQHYGVVAMPCRVRDPDRKGKVESGVGHAQKTPLKGMRFDRDLAEAQSYLDHWEERWADTRIHGTTKRQVAVMFAEEKPALRPLPLEPFRFYQYGARRVHLDGCVEVEAAYYSVPPGHIGGTTSMSAFCIRARGNCCASPCGSSAAGGGSCCAVKVGERTGALCAALHAQQGDLAARHIQGTLSFLPKYGAARLEQACATALDLQVPEYRFVRRYLEREAQPPVSLRQVDPLIRQLTLYRDLIAIRTQEEPTE